MSSSLRKGKQTMNKPAVTRPAADDERYQARKEKRTAAASEKRVLADKLKDEGNECYKNGEYEKAVHCYENAVIVYGPKAVYENNLAAALLKVGKYEEAEAAASFALIRDPKLHKARYRRAIARKQMGSYRKALLDLHDVLLADPHCEEAIEAMHEIYKHDEEFDEPTFNSDDEADSRPHPHDPQSDPETPVPSDSEDYKHEGNGVPCRHYNHEGCKLGAKCKFKHAPDNRSVRDDLGRNVCLYYLAHSCKFPNSECVYAHDKTYIQTRRFHDSEFVDLMHEVIRKSGAAGSAQRLEKMALGFKHPMTSSLWVPRWRLPASREAMQAAAHPFSTFTPTGPPQPSSSFLASGRAARLPSDPNTWDIRIADSDEEADVTYGGVSFKVDDDPYDELYNESLEEMAMYGLKPWDDDAWETLGNIQAMQDDYD